MTRIPVWARICVVIALVFAGVVASSMLLEASGIVGGGMDHGVRPPGEQGSPSSTPDDHGRAGHIPRSGH
jgi:hypothetical protein